MSTYLRDRAFVLGVKWYREADAWVSLWTEHHGKQEVFAAGLKRTNARQQGHLQPFSIVEVMIAHGKVLDRIAVARMTDHHGQTIRQNPAWNIIFGSLSKMGDRLTLVNGEEPQLFQFFSECLALSEKIQEPFSYERLWLTWAFSLHLLAKHLGYGISFTRCIRCGTSPIRSTAFIVKEGGFLCAKCDETGYAAHSGPFETSEELLRKGLQFFEKSSLEDVIRLSAPRRLLAELAMILEATLTTLPVDVWQKHKAYLQSYYLPTLSKQA